MRPLVLLLSTVQQAIAMRLVVQRVKSASVLWTSTLVSSIGRGVVALVGLHANDTLADAQYCARKSASSCGTMLRARRVGDKACANVSLRSYSYHSSPCMLTWAARNTYRTSVPQ